MKTITIEIPDGMEARWANGVLTFVDEQPIEFKYKVGDTVRAFGFYDPQVITELINRDGIPCYHLEPAEIIYEELKLDLCEPSKDITERIKIFEDACVWCRQNGFSNLVIDYERIAILGTIEGKPVLRLTVPKDVIAYLKLRIIICALNEGWEPMFDNGKERYYVSVSIINNKVDLNSLCVCDKNCGMGYNESYKLFFKSSRLAEYAATQFHDIYMDFCYKGKE